jgi:hypothetical protein
VAIRSLLSCSEVIGVIEDFDVVAELVLTFVGFCLC